MRETNGRTIEQFADDLADRFGVLTCFHTLYAHEISTSAEVLYEAAMQAFKKLKTDQISTEQECLEAWLKEPEMVLQAVLNGKAKRVLKERIKAFKTENINPVDAQSWAKDWTNAHLSVFKHIASRWAWLRWFGIDGSVEALTGMFSTGGQLLKDNAWNKTKSMLCTLAAANGERGGYKAAINGSQYRELKAFIIEHFQGKRSTRKQRADAVKKHLKSWAHRSQTAITQTISKLLDIKETRIKGEYHGTIRGSKTMQDLLPKYCRYSQRWGALSINTGITNVLLQSAPPPPPDPVIFPEEPQESSEFWESLANPGLEPAPF
jgi:hypothetical protein